MLGREPLVSLTLICALIVIPARSRGEEQPSTATTPRTGLNPRLASQGKPGPRERYKCVLVKSGDRGANPTKHSDQFVDLKIENGKVRSRIHFEAAAKEMTFKACHALQRGGSNFERWFAIECKTLIAKDGSSSKAKALLSGAYAGISPLINTRYVLFPLLSKIGKAIGLGTPARTFVIYANKKPQFEFLCYPPKKTK